MPLDVNDIEVCTALGQNPDHLRSSLVHSVVDGAHAVTLPYRSVWVEIQLLEKMYNTYVNEIDIY